ncbi:MAG: DUF1592 domain-containing protein [Planctomycetes bacterium]|nr:DUF1592 domain-containing protein [Planctomycetota bacterium]
MSARPRRAQGLATLALLALVAVLGAAEPASVGGDAWAGFAKAYCIECHGPDKQKGRLRLDQVRAGEVDERSYGIWKHVVRQLEKGEMPPEEATRRPAAAEAATIAAAISRSVSAAERSGRLRAEEVPLKRLNRVQYRNTMRDLMGVETTMADPTRGFPDDRGGAGFDVLGDDLRVSDTLMENYLRAASQMIDEAGSSDPRPERLNRQYIDTSDRYRLEGGIDGDPIGHEIYNHYDIERGYWTTPQECGHVRIIGGTPFAAAGWYRLTFRVESLWRDRADVTSKLREYSPKRPHQLAIRLLSPERTFPEIEQTVAIHDLPDNQAVELTHEVWVPKNWRLQLYFENGPACPLWVLHQELTDWKEIPTPPGATQEERAAIRKRNQDAEPKTAQSKEFMRTAVSPRIRLHKMAIDGPFYKEWPSAFQAQVLDAPDTRAALGAFARRAFRRPVTEAELEPFYRLAESKGRALAVKAMLCSPGFLYLREHAGRLDDDALACRLSYALTSSMPDSELAALAAAHTLSEPAVYARQVERLLASPGCDEFVDSFVSQWLHLRNIDKMPPDEKKYGDFYRISHGYTGTRDAIVREPVLFFKHLLANNLPVATLIDSDFTIMNDSLADFYGVQGVDSAAWRRVELAPGLKRGGLLGMAAVLAASANGVDTSPVVRGIFVLDNLLGQPPEPPPPGIKAPQTDLRGTTTIRTALDQHRSDASCSSCHRRIDPIGFALENFDASGRWRTRYANAPIDASGMLPGGKAFADIAGFKHEFGGSLDQVARNLVRKLLIYGTGRNLGAMDEDEVDAICARFKGDGYRLRDLVKAVCTSRIFITR